MNFLDQSSLFGAQWNRKPRKTSRKAVRRLFLESLESRQLMAVAPFDEDLPLEDFPGNYYPPQHAQAGTEGLLSPPATGDALAVGLGYLGQNGGVFGLSQADLSNLALSNRYTTADSGTTHLYMQQQFNGLPVADAVANVNLTASGQVITAAANFVGGLQYPTGNTALAPEITASDAVSEFAISAGLTYDGTLDVVTPASGRSQKTVLSDADLSQDPIQVQLQYVPNSAGGLDLAWQMIVRTPDNDHWYDLAVAASGPRTGEVIRLADWVSHATYTVFPQAPVPVQDPLYGPRATLTDPHDLTASPFGWHDINFIPGPEFTTTSGNNVFAAPNTGTIPDGTATLNFDFPLNFNQAPAGYQPAATTNLFYWANIAHDISYHYGFNENAGNFQFTNRPGTGGLANDEVNAISQVVGLNNAFMATPPDGTSPLLAMGTFTSFFGGFDRDADLDGSIIAHEYTHGISNRLTGGPANANALQALQSGGMGEGWSDWFGLLLTRKPTDTRNTPRTFGQFVLEQPLNGPGIRRFPYSMDMSINPLTLDDFNGSSLPGTGNSEVHNAGEIWASVLWDITWRLTEKYGKGATLYRDGNLATGAGGDNYAVQLIFDAMKLQPANPSFLEARNAIIAADIRATGGDNFELLWEAFARRGFGFSAVDPNSSSLNVNERFDVPAGPGRVSGTIFNDANSNRLRESGEAGLGGWVVYADLNNNGVLDGADRRTTTAADGTYSLRFFQSGQVTIRQVVQPGWTQTLPASNAGRVVNLVRGQTIGGQNFGNDSVPAEIRGVVWSDLDADGVREAGEPTLASVVVYVDLNNDNRLNVLEPWATTDNFGRFAIKNLTPGSFTLKVVPQPGMPEGAAIPTRPITVGAGQVLTGQDLVFTQLLEQDFGDLPNSYGTTRAANGARHGILPGFHLGALLDRDADGQPNVTATGDDAAFQPDPLPDPPPASPDDEDGIVFLTGLTPGFPATIQVTVNTGTAFTGRLHGWIDLNGDGDFANDPGEKIISGMLLPTGVHNVTFTLPASAQLGPTYARFRYGYESELVATGPALAGEVEDYSINLLANVPVAVPDTFNVQQGTIDASLDVLANDIPTTFGVPRIVPGSFPATLPSGSTLRLNPAGNRILFTPAEFALGPETFTYRVTDGNSVSAPGLVTVNVSVRDPLAIDDSVIIPFAATPVSTQINVLANDVFPFANTTIVNVTKITDDPATDPASMAIASGGAALNFTPPSGFKGTILYEYTISDADPTTADSTGVLTIQVVDVIGGAPQPATSHLAQLSIEVLSLAGAPISALNVGDEFLVRVTSDDLRLGGSSTNRGVQAAYLDLLFNRDLVEPVLNPANPLGFEITFDPAYEAGQLGIANSPAPGQIDEVGAFRTEVSGVGPDPQTVFTVRMRAKAATPSGQPIQIVGSPAEFIETPGGTISNDVVIMPNDPTTDPSPVTLLDEQVFLRPSSPLTIAGLGEGEFTNFANPLDVDRSGIVGPVDAVLIINELNGAGGGTLSPLDFAKSGFARPTNLLDVSMDSVLAPLDAILVINYLNGRSLLQASIQGEGEAAAAAVPTALAEGEASELLEDSGATDEALLAAVLLSSDESPPVAPPVESSASAAADDQVLQTTATVSTIAGSAQGDTPRFQSRFVEVEADAADELFASFAGSTTELSSRFNLNSRFLR